MSEPILGAAMSVAEHGLQRLRMSWEDYLLLPEKPKAEWVDGEWERVLRLDDATPAGEVVVGAHGTVPLDLRDVVPAVDG